jgi:hypothetical protein
VRARSGLPPPAVRTAWPSCRQSAVARANVNAVREISDVVAGRGSVSPFEIHAEDSFRVRMFGDRQHAGLRG